MSKIRRILQWFLSTRGELSERLVRGGVWVFVLRLFNRGLGFLRTIILAWLLSPNDFGLFGLALLFLSALESISKPGFNEALIQKKERSNQDLNVAWTVQILRGCGVALLLVIGAPGIAALFGAPRAPWIIRLIAVGFVVQSLRNIGMVYLRKDLEFHKVFIYDVLSTLANITVAIGIALHWGSVWALVLGLLTEQVSQLVLSYLIHPYRPRLQWSPGRMKKLFRFGRWVMGSSILVFLLNQGDDLFVGKVLGISALGLYQMAYRISNLPTTEITHVISRVSFPAFSKIKYDAAQLTNVYLRLLQVTTFVAFPMAAGIICLGGDFTRLVLGNTWMPMVPALQILGIWGAIRAVGATTGPLFRAIGRPDYGTKIQLLKFLLLIVMIYPFTIRWGLAGTAAAVVANSLIANPIADILAIRSLQCSAWEFMRFLLVPLVGCVVMMAGLFLLRSFSRTPVIHEFLGMIGFGTLLYLITIYLLDEIMEYGLKRTLHEHMWSRIKGV